MPDQDSILNNINNFKRFDIDNAKPVIAGILAYVIWLFLFVGFRIDHLYFIIFFLFMYLLHPITRSLILSFIFFLLFWIIYDSMRVYPNYLLNDVRIEEPYLLEKSLFALEYNGETYTPNEYFASFPKKIFDFLAGIFYLTWVPLPIGFGIYLFFKDRKMLLKFSFAFLLTNIFGFIIYYSYPAAPPWYHLYYGIQENFNIPGNAANLLRFDQLIGSPIFENMYNKNANVFAAIPSLHAAYPIILFYFGMKKKYFIASIFFFFDIIGIWFSAVYSLHHYIIDLLLGGICSIFAIFVFELLSKNSLFNKLIDKYADFSA